LETPPEYFQEAIGSSPQVIWKYTLTHTGATYIAVHFESFDLGPLDYLQMSDDKGEQSTILRGPGRLNGTNFWALRVKGDKMLLQVVLAGPRRGRGFVIDRYSAGLPKSETGMVAESICWYDDKQNAACVRGSVQYNHGKAVARLLVHTFYGDIWGTGFLISKENHFLSNEHVITSAEDAANTEYEFMAEAPLCSSYNCEGCWPGQTFFGAEFIQSSYDLDYTLVRIDSGSPAALYGYLDIDARLPNISEQIYVPQHPLAGAKEFAINSDVLYDSGGVCRIQTLDEVGCQGLAANVGYYADTEGGSSGSPVISAWTQKVVALHHCGGCLNLGVPILPIWNEIKCFIEPKAISGTSFTALASGGTNTVNIADPDACGWTIQTSCDWVTVSDTAGAGNSTVTLSAGFNSTGLARSCPLIIAGQNYTFNQAPCSFSISPGATSARAVGTNVLVTVTTVDGCGWNASTTNSWITIADGSGGTGSGQFSFAVLPNFSLTPRTGTVRVAGHAVSVTQAGDTEHPTSVSIIDPAGGTTYHYPQTVLLSATASDNLGISKVEFFDGAVKKAVTDTPPYTYVWAFGQTNNGAHSWTVKAYDAAGNFTVSPVLSLTVKITPPATSIVVPSSLQRWSNELMTVQGKASDDIQVGAVYCKANEGEWTLATTGNNWSNWTAGVTLTPGTNVLLSYAEDTMGNLSATSRISCVYVLSTYLALNLNGKGTLTPNYNGQLLELGRGYTITATPGVGFVFTNWTGSQTTNKSALSFLMASNLEFTANFLDVQRPTLSITTPLLNQRWSNELITVQGKTADNYDVDAVYWKVNAGDWALATPGTTWSNWTAEAVLVPGTNVIRAYAQDTTGNLSTTSSVSFVYVLSAPLSLGLTGKGTLSPNYSNQLLELGRGYTITATPGAGFVFTNWTGSQETNKPALSFLMASNLEFTANFVDVQRPTLSITTPLLNQRWSNELITVQGKTADNYAVDAVYWKVNTADWTLATPGTTWSNWTAEAVLVPGTNVIRAYARDTTGNLSTTGSVSFVYVLTAPLSLDLTGKGTLSPNYSNQLLELGRGYTITATPGAGFVFTNWTGSQTTNKPALSFLMASNLEFTANFLDVQRPTLSITTPLVNQRWSNELITLQGKTADNYEVDAVYWKVNTGDWTLATPGTTWSNCTAAAVLVPGTNVIRAYARDTTGNLSTTGSVSFVYVLSAPLSVGLTGKGTLSPNYSNQLLELGRGYTITATPGAGFVFTNWIGSQATNKPALSFLMASNLEFTANFVDVQRPTLSITTPLLNQRWSNELITVQGKTADNYAVEAVYWKVNTGDWTLATPGTTWSNWTAEAVLIPGTNVIRAYAQDTTGNLSTTSSVSFVYVLSAPLSVGLTGKGMLSPNYSNQVLELGRGYTITATPGAGFVFTNWTGSHTTNKPALWFLMTSNLEFTANFVDVQRPTLTITTPIAGQRTRDTNVIVQGKAADNWQVAAVFQKLNQNDWALASTTNGWTNWLAELPLTQTTNTLMAYAADIGGNFSPTNLVTFLATNLPPEFRLALESARVNNSGEMELHFNISPDAGGQIEVSTNLVDWEFFAKFAGTNPVIRFKDPGAATHHWRFYRGVAKRP
jgi:lysyl endopeptidase